MVTLSYIACIGAILFLVCCKKKQKKEQEEILLSENEKNHFLEHMKRGE